MGSYSRARHSSPPGAERKRLTLAWGLFALGAIAVTASLASNALGLATSPFDWRQAALLIAGCDLLVVALILNARRATSASDPSSDLSSLLSTALADGVMIFAIAAAAVIVVFGQHKSIERLDYFLAILVVVPLSATLAWRRQQSATTGKQQQLLAFVRLAGTVCVLCLARLLALPPAGPLDTSLFLLLALVAIAVATTLMARLMPAVWARGFPAQAAAAAAPLILLLGAAPFVPPAALGTASLAIALCAGLGTFCLIRAYGDGHSRLRTSIGVLDAAVLAICSLAVIYLGRPNLDLAVNQNYFLGPASDVIHGHPMLVGTFSQYGVGMIDALAAFFLLVPVGYGTFTLLLSGLTALLFAVIYIVLRWSTESLLLAVLGLSVAVILYVFGQIEFYATFPSTGVLRFGLPWLVVLCSIAAARTVRHQRLFDALLIATVAIATVWSGEAGAYCLGTASALVCLNAAVADASARERLRAGALGIARLIAASACGLLAFTLLTLALTGAWANWGAYIGYIRLYTVGGFGALPIQPWSPGLALGAMYIISATAIVLIALTRPALIHTHAAAFRAAAGLTVLGALVYTYFLGRAAENNLIHISLPAIALLFVWLGIARATLESHTAVAVAGATAVFLAAVIAVSESQDMAQKYPSTALAAVLGSAPSLGRQLSDLWRNPVVDPTAAHVVGFLKPLERTPTSLTILLTPNVETEALLRLGAANAVGSSNPCQESLSAQAPRRIAAAVHSLAPGGILLISLSPLQAGEVSPIETYTFRLLEARFKLRQIAKDGPWLAFRLTEPRAPAAAAPVAPQPLVTSVGCA
jgi:hypothetical protein